MAFFILWHRLASVILIVIVISSPCVIGNNQRSLTNYILYRANGGSQNRKVFQSSEDIDEEPLEGKTVFLVHGEGQSAETKLIQELKNALIQERQVHVFLVNWTRTPKRNHLRRRVLYDIAEDLRDFIRNTTEETFVEGEDLHCIGYSYGAHICGNTGDLLKKTAQMTLPRISGLAPKIRDFDLDSWILCQYDADFVDAIHTTILFRYLRRMGNVDFVPDKFTGCQPGCGKEGDCDYDCSRERALELYISSVKRKCEFITRYCQYKPERVLLHFERKLKCEPYSDKKYGKMGYDSPDAPGRDIQYVKTTDKEPFC